jgi:hypothetical protein
VPECCCMQVDPHVATPNLPNCGMAVIEQEEQA